MKTKIAISAVMLMVVAALVVVIPTDDVSASNDDSYPAGVLTALEQLRGNNTTVMSYLIPEDITASGDLYLKVTEGQVDDGLMKIVAYDSEGEQFMFENGSILTAPVYCGLSEIGMSLDIDAGIVSEYLAGGYVYAIYGTPYLNGSDAKVALMADDVQVSDVEDLVFDPTDAVSAKVISTLDLPDRLLDFATDEGEYIGFELTLDNVLHSSNYLEMTISSDAGFYIDNIVGVFYDRYGNILMDGEPLVYGEHDVSDSSELTLMLDRTVDEMFTEDNLGARFYMFIQVSESTPVLSFDYCVKADGDPVSNTIGYTVIQPTIEAGNVNGNYVDMLRYDIPGTDITFDADGLIVNIYGDQNIESIMLVGGSQIVNQTMKDSMDSYVPDTGNMRLVFDIEMLIDDIEKDMGSITVQIPMFFFDISYGESIAVISVDSEGNISTVGASIDSEGCITIEQSGTYVVYVDDGPEPLRLTAKAFGAGVAIICVVGAVLAAMLMTHRDE